MNSYVNMGLGALLGTVFVLMTVSIASEGLFHAEIPEKPGYVIAAADADASAEAADAPAAAVPVAQLMASADPANGEKLFKKCAACHTAEKGAGNKVGPNLFGVVGRPVAALPDFSYSAGMKEFSKGGQETWSFDNLNHFLTAPKKFIKGTAMGYAGDKKDKERADIMAYLNSKSDSPLPAPTE
jgi:cytochrome c